MTVIANTPSTSAAPSADAAKKKGAAFIYIHGGGWTVGSLPEFDTFFRIMAEEGGVQVYAIEYHLAPEHKVRLYAVCIYALCLFYLV